MAPVHRLKVVAKMVVCLQLLSHLAFSWSVLRRSAVLELRLGIYSCITLLKWRAKIERDEKRTEAEKALVEFKRVQK